MAFEDSRSLADLLKDIVGNLQQIVHAEIRLAQLEVREDVSKVTRAGASVAVGAVFCVTAFGFLLWAAVYAQSHGCVRMTNWDAARVATLVGAGTSVVFK